MEEHDFGEPSSSFLIGRFVRRGLPRRRSPQAARPASGCVSESYLLLLTDRVIALLNQADDTEAELDYLNHQLQSESLLDYRLAEENLGSDLLLNNPELRERLYLMGVPENLPKVLNESVPGARQLYQQTSLENWINALLLMPYDPDR